MVHPDISGDGEQPRPDVSPAVEPVHRSQGPDKGLLGDLLRQMFVPRESPDITVDIPEIQAIENLKVHGPPSLHQINAQRPRNVTDPRWKFPPGI